jgi:hypothetical protein
MSYDLLFWRQSGDGELSPEMIASALYDGDAVAGLHALPTEQVIARVNGRFRLTTEGGLTFWDGGDAGMFELYHSPQHIHFCCRNLLAEQCNELIDIMAEFRCPLYDPQVNRRFEL